MDFVFRGGPEVFIIMGGTAGFDFSGEPMRVAGGTLGCGDFQRCIKIKLSKQGENNIELSSRPGVAQVTGGTGGGGRFQRCIKKLYKNPLGKPS